MVSTLDLCIIISFAINTHFSLQRPQFDPKAIYLRSVEDKATDGLSSFQL